MTVETLPGAPSALTFPQTRKLPPNPGPYEAVVPTCIRAFTVALCQLPIALSWGCFFTQ